VTGGRDEQAGDWREDMHIPAIVVGTTDTLTSKALNRGYGLSRTMFPIDFALTANGAHWVIDEERLCPQSATTLRQLADFAGRAGTAETVRAEPAFRAWPAAWAGFPAARRRGRRTTARSRRARLSATRAGRGRSSCSQPWPPHSRSNRQLRGGPVDVTLLHSRLRGVERGGRIQAVAGQPRGPDRRRDAGG